PAENSNSYASSDTKRQTSQQLHTRASPMSPLPTKLLLLGKKTHKEQQQKANSAGNSATPGDTSNTVAAATQNKTAAENTSVHHRHRRQGQEAEGSINSNSRNGIEAGQETTPGTVAGHNTVGGHHGHYQHLVVNQRHKSSSSSKPNSSMISSQFA